MRYLITFSYDGSSFSGYGIQNDKRTIQLELEKALTMINSNKYVRLSASGRTDAGVHALGQTAHFDLINEIDCNILKKSLNNLLPGDIYIKSVIKTSDDFHARFNCLKKEYVYKINLGEYSPLERNYVYQYNKKLDIDKMKEASKFLTGKHDFKSFVKLDEDKDCVREIYKIDFTLNDEELDISFIGNGFLRYMVRNIVGTLINVGEGKIEVSSIKDIIESKNRTSAGITAPAAGLYLKEVFYK